jgi:plastocyanin
VIVAGWSTVTTTGSRIVRRALLAVAAASIVVVGCGSEGTGGEGASSDVSLVEGVESRVQGIDNSFRPETVTVQAGTEVIWENRGRNEHNVLPSPAGEGPEGSEEGTPLPESFGVQADAFEAGDEWSYRFTEPGTYHYYCSLHGTPEIGMVGTVVVTAGPTEASSGEGGAT